MISISQHVCLYQPTTLRLLISILFPRIQNSFTSNYGNENLIFFWGGGETLVFRGGYHAWVWPLKMDPKLRFWVNSKKATLNKDFDKFSVPQRIFEFSKILYPNEGYMGVKSYPNPMFIVSKKQTRISVFFISLKKHTLFCLAWTYFRKRLSNPNVCVAWAVCRPMSAVRVFFFYPEHFSGTLCPTLMIFGMWVGLGPKLGMLNFGCGPC